MGEPEAQKLAREEAEIEAQGEWMAGRSEDFLVGYVEGRAVAQQNNALVEMQRRLLLAIREFNEKSGQQAKTMIRERDRIEVGSEPVLSSEQSDRLAFIKDVLSGALDKAQRKKSGLPRRPRLAGGEIGVTRLVGRPAVLEAPLLDLAENHEGGLPSSLIPYGQLIRMCWLPNSFGVAAQGLDRQLLSWILTDVPDDPSIRSGDGLENHAGLCHGLRR